MQAANGSSPRQRGTPTTWDPEPGCPRFIPAPAGNAVEWRLSCLHPPVHPRASGERVGGIGLYNDGTGSSPRQRGTPVQSRGSYGGRRFIPAPAGNAPSWRTCARWWTVHPRASGERANDGETARTYSGSSPRQRGTHNGPRLRQGRFRFIPAPAGNARPLQTRAWRPAVHPRASGERRHGDGRDGFRAGSSPRQRGTLLKIGVLSVASRFIPAPAGNARCPMGRLRSTTVHPRASGERLYLGNANVLESGSSPRQRGTHVDGLRQDGLDWFIPAPAGNARCPMGRLRSTTVHPRASGERLYLGNANVLESGSSPRQRGTHGAQWGDCDLQRFIPAPAGNAIISSVTSSPMPVHPRASGERP